MNANQTLNTNRLALRPVAPSDVGAVWDIHSDPATNAHNPAGPMRDRFEATKLAQDWSSDWMHDAIGYWAIACVEAPERVIGFGGIRRTELRGRQFYNLYYRLASSTWGKGYASELATEAVAQWTRLRPHLPVIARTTPENVASQKTAVRAGLHRRPDWDEIADGVTHIVFALGFERER